MYEESSEYFQYMNGVDAEKIGFKKLIDIKEVKLLLLTFSLEIVYWTNRL